MFVSAESNSGKYEFDINLYKKVDPKVSSEYNTSQCNINDLMLFSVYPELTAHTNGRNL